MKKRGQFESHTLLYVLLGLFVLVLLVVGYKSILSFGTSADKTELQAFQTKLSSDVKALSYNIGSVRKFSYSLPTAIKEVCFLDSNSNPDGIGGVDIKRYPLIQNSYQSGAGKNVFVVADSMEDSYSVEGFRLGDDVLFACFPSENGYLDLRVMGSARGALIQKNFRVTQQLDLSKDTEIVSSDGAVSIIVHKNSVAAPGASLPDEIFIEVIPQNSIGNRGSETYKFGPSGIHFDPAAQLTMKYDPEISGDCPNQLLFNHRDDNGNLLETIPSNSVDCQDKSATFDLTSFTTGDLAAATLSISYSRSPDTDKEHPYSKDQSTTVNLVISPWSAVSGKDWFFHSVTNDAVTGTQTGTWDFDAAWNDVKGFCADGGHCTFSGVWQASQFNCGGQYVDHVRAVDEWVTINSVDSNHNSYYFKCSDAPTCDNIVYHSPELTEPTKQSRIDFCKSLGYYYAGLLFESGAYHWYGNCQSSCPVGYGYVCLDLHTCSGCKPAGQSCVDKQECCRGNVCSSGFCAACPTTSNYCLVSQVGTKRCLVGGSMIYYNEIQECQFNSLTNCYQYLKTEDCKAEAKTCTLVSNVPTCSCADQCTPLSLRCASGKIVSPAGPDVLQECNSDGCGWHIKETCDWTDTCTNNQCVPPSSQCQATCYQNSCSSYGSSCQTATGTCSDASTPYCCSGSCGCSSANCHDNIGCGSGNTGCHCVNNNCVPSSSLPDYYTGSLSITDSGSTTLLMTSICNAGPVASCPSGMMNFRVNVNSISYDTSAVGALCLVVNNACTNVAFALNAQQKASLLCSNNQVVFTIDPTNLIAESNENNNVFSASLAYNPNCGTCAFCLVNGQCLTYNDNQHCGLNNAVCVDCTSQGKVCQNGACVTSGSCQQHTMTIDGNTNDWSGINPLGSYSSGIFQSIYFANDVQKLYFLIKMQPGSSGGVIDLDLDHNSQTGCLAFGGSEASLFAGTTGTNLEDSRTCSGPWLTGVQSSVSGSNIEGSILLQTLQNQISTTLNIIVANPWLQPPALSYKVCTTISCTGCLSGTTCYSNNDNQHCGLNNVPCVDCTSQGKVCQNGACIASYVCSSANCHDNVGCGSASTGCHCVNNNCVPSPAKKPTCNDTDLGDSKFVRGKIYGNLTNSAKYELWDNCSGNLLLERYCFSNQSGKYPRTKIRECRYGCNNGVCANVTRCYQCTKGFLSFFTCNRFDCQAVEEGCYFIGRPLSHLCLPCANTKCSDFSQDKTTCESDPCKVGCEWDYRYKVCIKRLSCGPEICNNGVDDDCDGKIDLSDEDCWQCTSGTCCDSISRTYKPQNYACNIVETKYFCKDGGGCGKNVYRQDKRQYCSGVGIQCGPSVQWEFPYIYDQCATNEKCVNGASSCQAC